MASMVGRQFRLMYMSTQGDSMLQFGHSVAARDAGPQRNSVIASAVRHGFRRTERSNPTRARDCFVLKDASQSQRALLAVTPACLSRRLQHDFALEAWSAIPNVCSFVKVRRIRLPCETFPRLWPGLCLPRPLTTGVRNSIWSY